MVRTFLVIVLANLVPGCGSYGGFTSRNRSSIAVVAGVRTRRPSRDLKSGKVVRDGMTAFHVVCRTVVYGIRRGHEAFRLVGWSTHVVVLPKCLVGGVNTSSVGVLAVLNNILVLHDCFVNRMRLKRAQVKVLVLAQKVDVWVIHVSGWGRETVVGVA